MLHQLSKTKLSYLGWSVIQNQHRRLVEGHPVLNSNRISQPNNLATPQKYKTQTTINPFIK